MKINVLQTPRAYKIMTFKKHMFHQWKNELKVSRSWTVHLSTNIPQGLPTEPGGRADRAPMISFSYKPAPKLVAMGNAYCRAWIFGACQNFFTVLQLPLVPAPTVSSGSNHSIDICHCKVWNCVEKPNQGNRAVLVENVHKEGRADHQPLRWEELF